MKEMSKPPDAARDQTSLVVHGDPLGTPFARAVFEAAAEGLLLLTQEGFVMAMNASFAKLYGVDPSDAVGHHYTGFARNIEVKRLDATVEEESWVTNKALRGERVERVVQTVRNYDTGREFVARCSATPYFEGGNFIATTISVEDVTEWTLSQQRVEAALSAAEVGVWWIDLATERLWGDENFARIYGLTDEEVDGGPAARAFELIHPDDREQVRVTLQKAAISGEPCELEFRILDRNGCIRWVLTRGKSERDSDDVPVRRMGSAVDITRQKEAEESLRRTGEIFEYLVRHSPSGIYAVDADFRLALVSQGAERVFENVRPLIGRDFREVMRTVWDEPFASEAIHHFSHTLTTGEPYHSPSMVERRVDTDQVESYDWKIERVNLPDGRPGVVCHFYDLSEHQRYEADLERRVRERTEDLTRANEELNSFASSVAHDLRAPLRTIALTSQLLAEGDEGRLSAEERELLDRQARGAVRLGGIIDDLLRFARLANAEFHSMPFDFSRTARSAVVDVTSRGWSRPPSVEVQSGMRAQGDPRLIGYVLTNLLDNAMKFSPEGGQVVVGQEEGAFFVRDEGVGFDMAYAG